MLPFSDQSSIYTQNILHQHTVLTTISTTENILTLCTTQYLLKWCEFSATICPVNFIQEAILRPRASSSRSALRNMASTTHTGVIALMDALYDFPMDATTSSTDRSVEPKSLWSSAPAEVFANVLQHVHIKALKAARILSRSGSHEATLLLFKVLLVLKTVESLNHLSSTLALPILSKYIQEVQLDIGYHVGYTGTSLSVRSLFERLPRLPVAKLALLGLHENHPKSLPTKSQQSDQYLGISRAFL
jgi:hypothetical protein